MLLPRWFKEDIKRNRQSGDAKWRYESPQNSRYCSVEAIFMRKKLAVMKLGPRETARFMCGRSSCRHMQISSPEAASTL